MIKSIAITNVTAGGAPVPGGAVLPAGVPGQSAYLLAVGNGYRGDLTTWLASLKGAKGDQGTSAYTTAVLNGFTGDLDAWLASLIGPPGSNANVALVPTRVATGISAVTIRSSDYLVLINGPTQVNLEAGISGATHVIKDRGSLNGGNVVNVLPYGDETIDGLPQLTFSRVGEAATLTWIDGFGWSVY